MKCRVCREPAVISLRRHNANFCPEHMLRYCRQQVERVISDYAMFSPDDHLLAAVSGGKDSLALWDILVELGYRVDGLYVGLGIDRYSDVSYSYAKGFADDRELSLITVDLAENYGFDVPSAAASTGRVPCSACGLSKRHVFDTVATDGGYGAVLTGHNLDDEAAVLYGNVMRWQVDYLGRQRPVLDAHDGFPRKAKPLVRLTERETAAYCVLRAIDYQVEECPMAAGNKHLGFKEALNRMEDQSPGSKAEFYFGYLKRAADRFADPEDRGRLGVCSQCGGPTDSETCAFCRLVARSTGQAQPVVLTTKDQAVAGAVTAGR